jgi:hypothetical protein
VVVSSPHFLKLLYTKKMAITTKFMMGKRIEETRVIREGNL